MTARRGKALFEGPQIPFSPPLGKKIGAWPAKAAQQIHYYSVAAENGWVALSVGELADDLKCGHGTAGRALRTLVEEGGVDVDERAARAGGHRYRLRYDALQELLPRLALSADAIANADRIASRDGTRPSHPGTPESSQDGTPNPHAERHGGSSQVAAALDPDVDGDVALASEPRASSPVARVPPDEGGGGGGNGFIPLGLEGHAQEGTVLHALRTLTLRRPDQCSGLLGRIERGCAEDDRHAWLNYDAEHYGMEVELAWAVERVASYIRTAPAEERERIHTWAIDRSTKLRARREAQP